MKRGDVYKIKLITEKGSHVQNGYRPVIVISNKIHTKYAPTVTIIPTTSKLKKPWLPTHIKIQKGDIFPADSQTLVEDITSIDKKRLTEEGEYLGTITDNDLLDKIVEAVNVQVGE